MQNNQTDNPAPVQSVSNGVSPQPPDSPAPASPVSSVINQPTTDMPQVKPDVGAPDTNVLVGPAAAKPADTNAPFGASANQSEESQAAATALPKQSPFLSRAPGEPQKEAPSADNNNVETSPPPWLAGQAPPALDTSSDGGMPPPAGDDSPVSDSSDEAEGVKKSIFGKIIPILLAVLILAGIIFAVFKWFIPLIKNRGPKSPSAAKSQVTLTYWGLWEPEEGIADVIADYQEANPNVKIMYQKSSHKDYRERLISALSQKGSDSTAGPDIFRWHNTWLPMLKDYLAPIEDSRINIDDYFPVVKKDVTIQGRIYGLPLMFDCLSLYYNTDIFSKAGKQVPTTWEEVQKTAVELTVWDSANQIQTAGISLGTASNVDHFSDILGLMMLQNYANLADPTDELAADAMTFYTLFNTRDRIWDASLPPSVYAFAIGRTAMMFAPSWRAFDIKSINPDLSFKTTPAPQLPDTKIAWATYWVEGVADASKYKKEATDFLIYLSQDEVLRKLYDKQSKLRLFGEIYPKTALADELKDDPVVGSFVQQGPYAQSWYMASDTHDNGLNDSIIKYYENAVNAMVDEGDDAVAVLNTVAQGVSQVLNTYQITGQ